MERARRTAAIMPDWLEFDPPGVESNRPTMLTEEKKRREGGGGGGPPRPILSLSLCLHLFASLSPANRRKKARATTLRSVHLHARLCVRARTGTRLSSHFLQLVHALGTHPNHRQKSFFPTWHDRGISLFLISFFFFTERLSWFVNFNENFRNEINVQSRNIVSRF